MKIELDDFDDIYAFADLVNDAKAWRRHREGYPADVKAHEREVLAKQVDAGNVVEGTPLYEAISNKIEGAADGVEPIVDQTGPSLPEEAAQAPELDADGRRWDERIDSSNKGLNKDGTWRARRNHGLSDEEVTRIKGELIVERVKDVVGQEAWDEAMAPPEADETPAVTETHPLPTEVEETPDTETRDYTDLIENAKLIAGDQKDGLLDVLNAAKEFVKAHSPMAWTEFSQAVVPGKSVQGYEPDERRLILAAIEVYNAESAA